MHTPIKIFISRALSEGSPIFDLSQELIVKDQSLISFNALRFDAPEADWIFFYSRNAVRYFF